MAIQSQEYNFSTSNSMYNSNYTSQDVHAGWSSLSASGTASFTSIQSEVNNVICSQETMFLPQPPRTKAYANGRPGSEPVGGLAPVGDVVVPMLLLTLMYLFVKMRNTLKKHTKPMKRIFTILCLFSCFISANAQTPESYLDNGDYVTLSFVTAYNNDSARFYLEASPNGLLTQDHPTDRCLWQLGIVATGNTTTGDVAYNYTLQDVVTKKYLGFREGNNQSYTLTLNDSPTSFNLSNNGNSHRFAAKKGSYIKGGLRRTTFIQHEYWTEQRHVYVMCSWNNAPVFSANTWSNNAIHIEKWEQKSEGLTGHFSPEKEEFSYAETPEDAANDVRNLTFMFNEHINAYYQCVNRPEEQLLNRQLIEVDVTTITPTFYWESSHGLTSTINPSHFYDAANDDYPAPTADPMMSFTTPTKETADDGHPIWKLSLTPIGKSPMNLRDNLNGLVRWVDYVDRIVAEYTYQGQTYKRTMRAVRKSYHEEELPALTFSVNPVTYTFRQFFSNYTDDLERKVFDINATHQHGRVLYNVDNQAIKTIYEEKGEPQKISLFDWTLTCTFSNGGGVWLSIPYNTTQTIFVEAAKNETGRKRASVLTVTLSNGEHSGSVDIPLYQRGEEGGIQFYTQAGAAASEEEKLEWNEHKDNIDIKQPTHTAEQTIYYLPNQPIELHLPESGFSGYMRWYDYQTGKDPYYNNDSDLGEESTNWIRSPRTADGSPFSAINTPTDAWSIDVEGRSFGLYAINKADKGGILDEDNPSNPAPIIQGWNYNSSNLSSAYHTMACDVSAYTDYKIWYNATNTERIDSIQEPTLSYRQLFHLKPAEEIANQLADSTNAGKYLENYHYQAPAGKAVLLSTQHRYRKYRSHVSEMCYFYEGTDGNLHRITDTTIVAWEKDGVAMQPTYLAMIDYVQVSSEHPTTTTYTLKIKAGNENKLDRDLLLAKFVVEYTDIAVTGPSKTALKTAQAINNNFKRLAYINFNYPDAPQSQKIAVADGTTMLNQHLPWDQTTYGFVYPKGELATTEYKRGASQGIFPFYGEYALVDKVNKDWVKGEQYGGASNGFALYVDGTMEPGLVASISADATLCKGQTMYCSAWFCNPTPKSWSSEGNPIFRCNVQGKNLGSDWEDVEAFFVGELPQESGWQQIVFPIESAHNFDSTRVVIYNFATTNLGNDFMVDEISLFVSKLPIAAYHGKMACRTAEDQTTYAAAVLRIDYGDFDTDVSDFVYYQIFNENLQEEMTLTGEAAYYHEYNPEGNHEHPYGSIHIPSANFVPSNSDRTYYSVSRFLDDMMARGEKHGKAYIEVTNNNGAKEWLMYVAHIIPNTTDINNATEQLYQNHNYIMRMAYTPEELPTPDCNMQTPLHATQKTVFDLHNVDGKQFAKDFAITTDDVCANDMYALTVKVTNSMAEDTGSELLHKEAPIIADWLVGDTFDDIWDDHNVTEQERETANAAFQAKYGYRRGEIESAIMYDMRRPDNANPNYKAKSFEELQSSAFQSQQNYEIVRHLCQEGLLELYKPTKTFYLGSQDVARYWAYPIAGTAVTADGETLNDCNEAKWVKITSEASPYSINLAPIKKNEKTLQQRTELPTLKVVASHAKDEVQIPLTELTGGLYLNGTALAQGNQMTITLLPKPSYIDYCDASGKILTGEAIPTSLVPGGEYIIRISLTDGHGFVYEEDNEEYCRIASAFVHIEVMPDTVVWSPKGTSFNGWGLDENWSGWTDLDKDGVIDSYELTKGYVPVENSNVVIPKLSNPQLYPYIVHEEGHNHYPMTINNREHRCGNIYFQDGARIFDQHLLQYDSAFVDMTLPATKWNMMSSPLKDMYAGDMFIPHSGDWSNGQLLESKNPFVVQSFQGTRTRDAAYAFWLAFYNKTLQKVHGAGQITESQSAEFAESNSLVQPLEVGSGFQLLGFGPDNIPAQNLTIRLPKPDKEYAYYTPEGYANNTVAIPARDSAYRLAFTPYHDVMEITLTNAIAGNQFVFGNPTMAYIDMKLLLEDPENAAIFNSEYYYMQNESWQSATTQVAASALDRFLPPMRSVMLKLKNGKATSATIKLKTEHTTLDNYLNKSKAPEKMPQRVLQKAYVSSDEEEETQIMTIYALAGDATARCVLATTPSANDAYTYGEDALFISSGIEHASTGVVTVSPLNMYTIDNRVPMMTDVRKGIHQVPLAMLVQNDIRTQYMQIAFSLSSNWNKECYFCDAVTGNRMQIMDGLILTVPMPANHAERYYIEGPDPKTEAGGTTTSIENITNATDDENNLQAYSITSGTLTISANKLIQEVIIYDMVGRIVIHEQMNMLTQNVLLNAPSGIGIVEAIFEDHTKARIQAVVK